MTVFKITLILISFIFSTSMSIAGGVQLQVINKDIQLTKELVQNVEVDPKYPQILRIVLTDEGKSQLNKLILNSYDKKLNIIFNDKIVTSKLEIKMFEITNNDLDLVTPSIKIPQRKSRIILAHQNSFCFPAFFNF